MGAIILSAISLGTLWAIMTLGVYITYRILDIADLTVEGSIATGAAVAAHFISTGMNPWAATGLALISGMIAGLATGLLHTKLKIPPLLAGILTMIALYSVNLRIMGKSNIPLLKTDIVFTGLATAFSIDKNISILIIGTICTLAVSLFMYWFFGTEMGSAVRATGSNPQMARAQGINTDNMINIGLVISNGLVAFSGALIAQNQSFADVQMGTGSIVIGLASLIIGEVLFAMKTNSFKRVIFAVYLGAVLYRIIIALVLKAGMNPNDLKLFTAITVAVCLALPVGREYFATIIKSVKGGGKNA
ncbi:MAG: ABC transporter permease [Clostridiales bacterium]|nr:ABC transporter permease [Clostridiales bacterium]